MRQCLWFPLNSKTSDIYECCNWSRFTEQFCIFFTSVKDIKDFQYCRFSGRSKLIQLQCNLWMLLSMQSVTLLIWEMTVNLSNEFRFCIFRPTLEIDLWFFSEIQTILHFNPPKILWDNVFLIFHSILKLVSPTNVTS